MSDEPEYVTDTSYGDETEFSDNNYGQDDLPVVTESAYNGLASWGRVNDEVMKKRLLQATIKDLSSVYHSSERELKWNSFFGTNVCMHDIYLSNVFTARTFKYAVYMLNKMGVVNIFGFGGTAGKKYCNISASDSDKVLTIHSGTYVVEKNIPNPQKSDKIIFFLFPN